MRCGWTPGQWEVEHAGQTHHRGDLIRLHPDCLRQLCNLHKTRRERIRTEVLTQTQTSQCNASLRLFDTGEDKELRSTAYPGADVVLVCFPVEDLHMSGKALKNQLTKFATEAGNMRTVLVGMKSDTKKDDTSSANGWNLAKELSAQIYLECSSTANDDSVPKLFNEVITIFNVKKNKRAMLSDVRQKR